MDIFDKLTPNPPQAETGAPGAVMTADQVKVVDIITSALRDHGLILTPEQLAMKPAPVPPPLPPKPALTYTEETLLGRSMTFIRTALASHGISLSPNEVKWVGAMVADFVQSELAGAVAAKPAAPPVAGVTRAIG